MSAHESRGTMLVELSVTDMGSISIALDYFVNSQAREAQMNPASWRMLQERWDKLYKSTHGALDAGLRRLDGR